MAWTSRPAREELHEVIVDAGSSAPRQGSRPHTWCVADGRRTGWRLDLRLSGPRPRTGLLQGSCASLWRPPETGSVPGRQERQTQDREGSERRHGAHQHSPPGTRRRNRCRHRLCGRRGCPPSRNRPGRTNGRRRCRLGRLLGRRGGRGHRHHRLLRRGGRRGQRHRRLLRRRGRRGQRHHRLLRRGGRRGQRHRRLRRSSSDRRELGRAERDRRSGNGERPHPACQLRIDENEFWADLLVAMDVHVGDVRHRLETPFGPQGPNPAATELVEAGRALTGVA